MKIIQRFKEDPDCRVFLSTDAGGVGLNLQTASIVVNMDLPWNPAILEQRIGRVHRLGQVRPVRVINFISEGTIEQGMLSLLAFKKSLFSGALDGGQDEVLLSGSRLNRFMESVEKVSDGIARPAQGPIPEADKQDESELLEIQSKHAAATKATDPKTVQTPPTSPASDSRDQTANELISAGITFLEKLSIACQGNFRTGSTSMVVRDPESGQDYLKLPLPDADAIQSLGTLLQKLGEAFRPRPR